MKFLIDYKAVELVNHARRNQGDFENIRSLQNFFKAPRFLKRILKDISKQAGCLFAHLLDEYSYSLMNNSIILKVSINECAMESGIYKQDIKKVFHELSDKNAILLLSNNETRFGGDVIVIIPCMFIENETKKHITILSEILNVSVNECEDMLIKHRFLDYQTCNPDTSKVSE